MDLNILCSTQTTQRTETVPKGLQVAMKSNKSNAPLDLLTYQPPNLPNPNPNPPNHPNQRERTPSSDQIGLSERAVRISLGWYFWKAGSQSNLFKRAAGISEIGCCGSACTWRYWLSRCLYRFCTGGCSVLGHALAVAVQLRILLAACPHSRAWPLALCGDSTDERT